MEVLIELSQSFGRDDVIPAISDRHCSDNLSLRIVRLG